MFQSEFYAHREDIIKIIGIGGGGCNAVNYMHQKNMKGVKFFICNTDAQCLEESQLENKIHIGPELTQGLGAGSNPEVGRQATIESEEYIRSVLSENTKMVFITAGMGGGTGTGGAPIIAKIAKELGILTIGVVTTPFNFEGKKRMQQAEEGINNLKNYVDTLLIISNEKLKSLHKDLSMSNAFNKADDILLNSTKCVTDVINTPGKINVDFADVCTVMRGGGVAIFGNAEASGEDRASKAITNAIVSPLLNDNDISGAKWILLNISSPKGENEVTMQEIDIIQEILIQHVGENSNLILGTSYNSAYENQIGITLIATAFQKEMQQSIASLITNKEKTTAPSYSHTEIDVEKQIPSSVKKVVLQERTTNPSYTQASLFQEVEHDHNEAEEMPKEKKIVLSEEMQHHIINQESTPNFIHMGFTLKKPQTIYQATNEDTSNAMYSTRLITEAEGYNETKNESIVSENEFTLTDFSNEDRQENEYISSTYHHEQEDSLFSIKEISIDESEHTEEEEIQIAKTSLQEDNKMYTSFYGEEEDEDETHTINPFLENSSSQQKEEEKMEVYSEETSSPIHDFSEVHQEKENNTVSIESKLSAYSIDPTKVDKKVLNEQPSYLRNETIKRFVENSKNSVSHYKVESDQHGYSKINAVNQFLFGHKPD